MPDEVIFCKRKYCISKYMRYSGRMSIEEKIRTARQGSLGWLLQRVAARFEARMNEGLRAEGLTIQQVAVLMHALEHDGQTQTEIGAAFAMPPWAISRALDGLAAAGLVTRRACPLSRRAHRIHVTESGRSRAPALQALVGAVNAEMAAPLSGEDRAQLHALLTRLEAPR